MYKFNFHSPKTIKKSIEIFKNSENPKYIAGGVTLLGAMKQKMSMPSDLIDLSMIEELQKIQVSSDILVIGAMNTHNKIAKSPEINEKLSGFSDMARNIADNAVRNMGTIGGSICNADPAADYPAALLACNAEIITNKRKIKAIDFFVDMFETCLHNEEIVIEIKLAIPDNTKYFKFSSTASRYALIGLFVAIKNKKVNFSITGASNKAFILKDLENINIDTLDMNKIDDINFENYKINGDIHASKEYRISLIKTMLKRAINFTINK